MQLTSSAVPFKGLYRFKYDLNSNSENSFDKSAQVDDFAYRNGFDYKIGYFDKNGEKNGEVVYAKGQMSCPHSKDFEVEKFLSAKGINYKKVTLTKILESAILPKFKMPDNLGEGYQIAMLDIQKFDELYKSQDCGNIKACEEKYQTRATKATHDIIDQDEITAPLLHICSYSVDEDGYIPTAAGKNRASLIFNGTTQEPNECLYFALRQVGLTKMPVAVDEETLAAGKELGIF
ncbi:MAG: hypothetical protein IJ003_06075 [Candidatus Gastranaerophilales bacterium]|nr:hypothetical protein [Candidatus Gastranaerophilales bacterium]